MSFKKALSPVDNDTVIKGGQYIPATLLHLKPTKF